MNEFFDDNLFLSTPSGKALYEGVRGLPIIDYHCHLDQTAIARNDAIEDIGVLWLAGDHYKWRAMRLCGIDETYITGDASWREKFRAYASVVPMLAGNPLYYWTHLELREVFGIEEPLSAANADDIYDRANAVLKGCRVRDLLEKFRVEYIATTDDPLGDLSSHGTYGGTRVAPTFRADNALKFDSDYIAKLSEASGKKIASLSDYLAALSAQLDRFCANGCVISDQGFADFPTEIADEKEAASLFARLDSLNDGERGKLFGFLLVWLAREYGKRRMLMQLHVAVTRNVNPVLYAQKGADIGCDVFTAGLGEKNVLRFLAALSDEERPSIVLYSLNAADTPMLAAISGAFRNVRMGAAWWFNDTVCGIRNNLSVIAEYACLGTNFGMLTDSRSFSSYVRFDFFRRILCDVVGAWVDEGEYDFAQAQTLVYDVCYGNIAKQLGVHSGS